MLTPDALGIALHRLLHPERRIARPHGVVFVGERRAEERHDPVAHHLIHRALVTMHGLHHVFQYGVEELARLLGIAVGEQLHRALEIGEEDGDLLALTLQRGLGREDFLGEVLGSVRLRCAERGRRLGRAGRRWDARTPGRTWRSARGRHRIGYIGEQAGSHIPRRTWPVVSSRAGIAGTACAGLHARGPPSRHEPSSVTPIGSIELSSSRTPTTRWPKLSATP